MSSPGRAPAGPAGGFSVAEALVALLLGCLVVGVALATLGRQRAVQSELTARAERLGAARLARHFMYYDPSRARSELGLPATPVDDAIDAAMRWFSVHNYL